MENYYDVLLHYALRLITRKRYTEQDLKKKLFAKKIGTEHDKFKVISRLKELKYIDDKAFARDYISTKVAINPKGERLLKIELRKKGIDAFIIEDEIESAHIDEEFLAKKVISKYKRRYNGLDKYKKKEKIMRLLVSRGFKIDTIYKVLDRC
ncbi:regulatory protein RecX [bacterium]|nr:regulatory protein RecX [bacterium]